MLVNYILFSALIYSVLSYGCVRYTFKENFELFSNNLDGCGTHQGLLASWTRQTYTNTNVLTPNPNTDWFISPSTSLSCISSFPFSMESGGMVEVHVYIDPTEREDHLAVMVHQIVDIGSHPVVGMGHVSGHSSPGWLVTRIILTGPTQFSGYITFLGVAYPGSILIVDSFRYVSPSLDPDESCILYEDDNSITTISIATPAISETPTPTTVPSITETTIRTTNEASTLGGDCVIYTFEENFESFSNNLDGCGNHQGLPSSWSHQTYNNTSIQAPNEKTNWFMSPSTSMSCISSFPFTMKSFGVLEVQVYLDTKAAEDHIAVLVHQIVDSGSHPVVGMSLLNGDQSGWQVARINLVGITQFDGYVTFLGIASTNSVAIVDSFRYVGPSLDPDEKCFLYEDENAITTISITTPSISETPMPTTVPSITEKTTRTTTETSTLGDDCVKYTFEENFESFSNNLDGCGNHQGLPSSWSHQTYNNTTIQAPNDKTNWFMSPSTSMSCISSFPFTMKSFGVLEVQVYLDSKAAEDHIAVLVHQIVDSGSHPVVGMSLLSGDLSGWQIARINLVGVMQFDGYVTFLGIASTNSVVIVDSFRYVGPSLDPNEKCFLYEDDNAIPTIPITTPTVVPSTTSPATSIIETTTLTMEPTAIPTPTPSDTEITTPTRDQSTTPTEIPSITEITTPTIELATTPTIELATTPTIELTATPSIFETTTSSIFETTTPLIAETTIPPTTETINQNTDCIRYTFEKDFEKLFTNNTPCVNMFGIETLWSRHEYSTSTIIPQNEQSKWFISPSNSYSCVSSFNFIMTANGLIEIHAYIDAHARDDQLQVWVNRIVDSNHYILIGHGFLDSVDQGWHIISIYLSALSVDTTTPFEGYIIFTGLANPNSIVIVDSFRYVPPSMDSEKCILYQNESTTPPTPTETTTPTTNDGMILTTTDKPTLTTTDAATDTDPDNNLEKIIIIKKTKTIRTESTVIKKVFRFD